MFSEKLAVVRDLIAKLHTECSECANVSTVVGKENRIDEMDCISVLLTKAIEEAGGELYHENGYPKADHEIN